MKQLIAGAVFVAVAPLAMADNGGPAGCGVGTAIVFPDASAWPEHVLAATTNGSSFNTSSMTSGLLNCKSAGGPLQMSQLFMDDNMDQLAMDAAKGEGETLAALAELMGVQAQDTAAFNRTVQANFDKMFHAEATSGTAHQALTAAMANNAQLQKYLG
ncbi:hypothetical protein GCM10011297_28900 [Bacterioplanes sanyensis]|uniref:DUF3015 family protein n=1 Tax=Bacterioplanes sanyensis TaxID=1249553 RepID=UPI001679B16E|nr:DUF3015 family protein [Bacterioplanes sanyensis]GGY54229.1 hypothetical protein GCM10011297_28900 [Bacterioplanes sanyensis]